MIATWSFKRQQLFKQRLSQKKIQRSEVWKITGPSTSVCKHAENNARYGSMFCRTTVKVWFSLVCWDVLLQQYCKMLICIFHISISVFRTQIVLPRCERAHTHTTFVCVLGVGSNHKELANEQQLGSTVQKLHLNLPKTLERKKRGKDQHAAVGTPTVL